MTNRFAGMLKWLWLGPVIALVVGAVAWPAYLTVFRGSGAPAAEAASVVAEPPANVTVVTVRRRDLSERTVLTGAVAADVQAVLYAKISGYLKGIEVDEGDWVGEKQTLAEIAVPEIDQDLISADAEILYAQNLQRDALNAVTEAELAAKEAELAKAEAANQQIAAEIALREAKAAAGEAEAARTAARAEAHFHAVTYQRVLELYGEGSATAQEKDAAEGKRLTADTAAKVAEGKVVTAQLKIEAAHARVKAAETAVKAAEARAALFAAKAASARDKAAALETKVKIAESAKARVKAVRDYSEIKAPFAGVVTARHVDPGAMIQNAAGSRSGADALVTLAAMDRVRVAMQVPEPQVKTVAVGAACELEVDALPGRKFKGRIVRTSKALDVRTRTMPAEAEFDNERSGPPDKPDFALYPGMFGRVTLDLRTVPGALVIPAAALAIENNRPYVYAVRDGKVLRIAAKLGHDDGIWVQIVDTPGIREGDQLIVGDKAGLADGRAVTVVRGG